MKKLLILLIVVFFISSVSAWSTYNLSLSSLTGNVTESFETDNDSWSLNFFNPGGTTNTIERTNVFPNAKDGSYVIQAAAAVCGIPAHDNGLYMNKILNYSGTMQIWYWTSDTTVLVRIYKNNALFLNATSLTTWAPFNLSINVGDNVTINTYRYGIGCGSVDFSKFSRIDFLTTPAGELPTMNLTFLQSENLTRILRVPQGPFVIRGFMNISGYSAFTSDLVSGLVSYWDMESHKLQQQLE